MPNLKILNSIRKKVNLPKTKNNYFSLKEMKTIVSSIKPNANLSKVSVSNILPSFIDNWEPQKTIASHPNSTNLYTIFKSLSSKQSTEWNLVYIIKNMPDSVLKNAESISLKDKELVIKFLNH
jgi:hypothetical protein